MEKVTITGIYKIVSPSGKIYIGQSQDIEKRKKDYKIIYNRVKEQIRLYNSLKKYGFDAHTFSVIEECLFDELNIRERYWQEHFDCIGKNGLNCQLTNTDEKKKVLSDESRKKMSDARKGENHHMFGKSMSEESKKKISNSLKGEKHPMFGKIQSKEVIENRSKKLEKKVIDTVTGQIYNSIKQAAETLNMDKGTLSDYLKGRYKNKTNLIYYKQ